MAVRIFVRQPPKRFRQLVPMATGELRTVEYDSTLIAFLYCLCIGVMSLWKVGDGWCNKIRKGEKQPKIKKKEEQM